VTTLPDPVQNIQASEQYRSRRSGKQVPDQHYPQKIRHCLTILEIDASDCGLVCTSVPLEHSQPEQLYRSRSWLYAVAPCGARIPSSHGIVESTSSERMR